jgi:hypothetical protein
MTKSQERTVSLRSDSVASYLVVDPKLETFDQFNDVCTAAYGSVHGEQYYEETLPKVDAGDFERSHIGDTTEIRFLRKAPYVLDRVGQKVAEVLTENHGIPVVLELPE